MNTGDNTTGRTQDIDRVLAPYDEAERWYHSYEPTMTATIGMTVTATVQLVKEGMR